MKVNEAKKLTRQLLAENNINEYMVKISNSKMLLGQANGYHKYIKLSRHLIELNNIDIIKDIILHEIAHVLTLREFDSITNEGLIDYNNSYKSHGKVFKSYCRKLNCSNGSYISNPLLEMPKPKQWFAICKNCGISHCIHRHRKPTKRLCKCYYKNPSDLVYRDNCRLNFE